MKAKIAEIECASNNYCTFVTYDSILICKFGLPILGFK